MEVEGKQKQQKTQQTTDVNQIKVQNSKTAKTKERFVVNYLRMISPYPMVVHVMTAQYNDVKYLSHGVATPIP